jgi:hypothetical protein
MKMQERKARAFDWLLLHPKWFLYHRNLSDWNLQTIEKSIKEKKLSDKPTIADVVVKQVLTGEL